MKHKATVSVLALLVLVVFVGGLAYIYRATQRIILIEINGIDYHYRTHQRTSEGVLRELGIQPRPQDQIQLPSEEELAAGEPIRIVLARTVVVIHDGYADTVQLVARSVSNVLSCALVSIGIHDKILMDNHPVSLLDSLPSLQVPAGATLKDIRAAVAQPVHLVVERALQVNVTDNAVSSSFYTTEATVGQALYSQDIFIYEGDRIYPSLDDLLSPEMNIVIERSKPVVLDSGGTVRQIRTRLSTVSELLAQENVKPSVKDYITPDPRTEIASDMKIVVVRVRDEYAVTDEYIPYRVLWLPDPDLELDARAEVPGLEGIIRTRVRIRYENDVPVYRTEEEVWVAREPQDRILKYGTKIVLRTLDTPSGPITYWRKIRMLVTSYSPSDAGTPFSSPWFGYTYLGLKATKGIVAVDPNVIDLGTWVYVPGYGKGYAADIGGLIKNKHIDLCYDDFNYVNWYQYEDVYLLVPVPDDVNPILPGEGPPVDVDND